MKNFLNLPMHTARIPPVSRSSRAASHSVLVPVAETLVKSFILATAACAYVVVLVSFI
jgi:hypothetical protein